MSIKTNYNFKGIEIENAIIRIIRIFGSSKEGWSSLVGVYNTAVEVVEAVEADSEKGIEAQEATTKEVLNLIEEFNHSAPYKEDERGYVSVYNSLTEKFGGAEV